MFTTAIFILSFNITFGILGNIFMAPIGPMQAGRGQYLAVGELKFVTLINELRTNEAVDRETVLQALASPFRTLSR